MAEFGKNILYFDCVTSTFDELTKYPPENGLVVVADRQTGGIGRKGRAWVSDMGGAYFSFYILPDDKTENIPFLAIVCALAAYNTISRYTTCAIKWPNDIVSDGKKVCGILTKSAFNGDSSVYVMAGIGINANNTDFGELDYRATSLKLLAGKEIDRNKLVEEFFEEFNKIYLNLSNEEIIRLYKNACVTLGSHVAVHYNTDGTVFEGKCIDVRTDGSVDIKTENGIINVNAGEVSVRGIYGYV
ncbi:MAG: biotin--[Clostridia bacterium]|nr:biotin--[acetyl-CoA-carboxylase] ligase [Clostridia bacterium]